VSKVRRVVLYSATVAPVRRPCIEVIEALLAQKGR